MTDSRRFIWLDAARGASAVAVCASHLRAVALVDYGSAVDHAAWVRAFYFATGLGHQAVMVFFVLSGFLVGGAQVRAGDRFDPARYATARLTRLWIVLVPALVLTWSIDLVLRAHAPQVLSGTYRALWNSGPEPSGRGYSSSFGTFIANVLFLQTIVAPVYGTNGALWSLANEFWYYVLCPIALVAIRGTVRRGRLSRVARAGLVVAGVALAAWLPRDLLAGFLIWALGLIVHRSMGGLGPRTARATLLVGAVAFLGSLAYSKLDALQNRLGIPADAVIGAAFCLLSIGIVNAPRIDIARTRLRGGIRAMSECSFSLYLIHFPLVALIGGLFYDGVKLQPDARGLLLFSAWFAALLAAGLVFYRLFERRTTQVRRWVDGRLGMTAPTG